MKIRVGILFGGISREREVSFAGGRTVYDNLDKTLFEPVPIFVDSFGNFILPDWHLIYKGSIRDFYPPSHLIPDSPHAFQVYAESLGNSRHFQEQLAESIGKKISPENLSTIIDFAFLCLHGAFGEDGRIQGLLEYYNIPYSGSGILPSSIGMNKAIQKKLMTEAGYNSPAYFTLRREEWMTPESHGRVLQRIKADIGVPCVVKAANQGSSIGIGIIDSDDPSKLEKVINRAFFIRRLPADEWSAMSDEKRTGWIRNTCDIREGIGMPVILHTRRQSKIIFHPEELLTAIQEAFFQHAEYLMLEGCDSESEVLVEQFIEGKEFSCIVIRNENGLPVALPPTEIKKGNELFDYRSKYLPGLSRKITPIQLSYEQIQGIRKECERLFLSFGFNVYARIDGFITPDGTVFLNDPNTTSGMMPSSFFFHQAAEIGLNPSQFLTYIIRTSLSERIFDMKDVYRIRGLLEILDAGIRSLLTTAKNKTRVAVIMGGYSSERHISVESGRNIFEKLSSSGKYEPFPVFLSGNDDQHILYRIPVSLMLKDNADDIKDKTIHFEVHEIIREIMEQCSGITDKYTTSGNVMAPEQISYGELSRISDAAFIALHGRPGEDGEVQKQLEEAGIPYNGSGPETSHITINKFETNELLRKNGFHVARHELIGFSEWEKGKSSFVDDIQRKFSYPFIAKPVDDGCSSAVKIIRSENDLIAFAGLMFRESDDLIQDYSQRMKLKPKEEFPRKNQFLAEELIEKKDAQHFLEITGGMLTLMNNGKREYLVFEASEALSEGDVLSLEEKFLAGEGQNITPARYDKNPAERQRISEIVKEEFRKAAILLNIEGYARIDAFVRIFGDGHVEVIFIEINSLPGMTPATCIFHQAALQGFKPYEFIDRILDYGMKRKSTSERVI